MIKTRKERGEEGKTKRSIEEEIKEQMNTTPSHFTLTGHRAKNERDTLLEARKWRKTASNKIFFRSH